VGSARRFQTGVFQLEQPTNLSARSVAPHGRVADEVCADLSRDTWRVRVRFKTHENLIDLLVGQNLYSTPNAAMRELLQNAEDACQLQEIEDPGFEARIDVAFSRAGNWVEISDNGIGMDAETFEYSFTNIGASKTDSPKLAKLLAKAGADRPIGQFGIGVLSCFGVAERVDVFSRAEGTEPLAYRIGDRRHEFEVLSDVRETRGTAIRLYLKRDGPMNASHVPDAVAQFVRHAQHIWIADKDEDKLEPVPDRWRIPIEAPSYEFSSEFVRHGYIRLAEAWDNISVGIDSRFTICNAGFLVTEGWKWALHPHAIGVHGEVDLRPGALTISMNREGFQQDEKWSAFSDSMLDIYRSLVSKKLQEWIDSATDKQIISVRRARQRMAYLIVRGGLADAMGEENVNLARKLLPEVLLLSVANPYFTSILTKAKDQPPLYVAMPEKKQQVQRSLGVAGENLTLTEMVQSAGLRATLLKANGFAVVQAEQHGFSAVIAGAARTFNISDIDVLSDYCNPIGIPVARVEDAPYEHTQIGSSGDAEIVSEFMQLSSKLKIQNVSSMNDAIIPDFSGYILNPRNVNVRRILNVVPDAAGNSIRKALLEAYFCLSTWDIGRARDILLETITDPEFESKSRGKTGKYFKDFLSEKVHKIIEQGEDE
jgi:hypothetical protein